MCCFKREHFKNFVHFLYVAGVALSPVGINHTGIIFQSSLTLFNNIWNLTDGADQLKDFVDDRTDSKKKVEVEAKREAERLKTSAVINGLSSLALLGGAGFELCSFTKKAISSGFGHGAITGVLGSSLIGAPFAIAMFACMKSESLKLENTLCELSLLDYRLGCLKDISNLFSLEVLDKNESTKYRWCRFSRMSDAIKSKIIKETNRQANNSRKLELLKQALKQNRARQYWFWCGMAMTVAAAVSITAASMGTAPLALIIFSSALSILSGLYRVWKVSQGDSHEKSLTSCFPFCRNKKALTSPTPTPATA